MSRQGLGNQQFRSYMETTYSLALSVVVPMYRDIQLTPTVLEYIQYDIAK